MKSHQPAIMVLLRDCTSPDCSRTGEKNISSRILYRSNCFASLLEDIQVLLH